MKTESGGLTKDRSFRMLKDLTIMDDYMFGAVMQDETLCQPLLERILHVRIDRIEEISWQETMKDDFFGKGIRMDVYVKDGKGEVYDVEVQVSSRYNLAKRARYYHSMIDRKMLESGEDYEKMRNACVIFICPFDPVGDRRCLYTFRSTCQENPERVLEDGSTTIFLNTNGQTDGLDKDLQALVGYLKDGTVTDIYTSRLEDAVDRIRQDKDRGDMYMSLMVKMMDWKRDGLIEGRAEGLAEGRIKGRFEGMQEGRMNMLKQAFVWQCGMYGKDEAIRALKQAFNATDEEIALILKETPETANA